MGPYLDGLPAAVTVRVKNAADALSSCRMSSRSRRGIAAERPSACQTMFAQRRYLPDPRFGRREIRRWV